jgi:hypothetical protein
MYAMPNTPAAELARTPAADVIGRMASASGLLLSHFEHRHHLSLPDAWLPAHRPDLDGRPVWRAGRLMEHKYQHFHYDNPVGSFHPGHRAKWTAHELCHSLVGFVWTPEATLLDHVAVARINEALPVALYYFHDEAGLRRCARHSGGGPLFGQWCPACERAALEGPSDASRARWNARGRAYVEAELEAVARARRTGTLAPNRWATLELESDALAYMAAHNGRMASPEFAKYMALFHDAGTGRWGSIDDLEARVYAMLDAITDGTALPAPLSGGRARYIAQDLGWRVLQVTTECGGELVDLLHDLVETYAAAPEDVTGFIGGYETLCEDWFLPPARQVFATGYDLPGGYGRDPSAIIEGLAGVCANTAAVLDEAFEPTVAAFVAAEPPVRGPVARRFATWLAEHEPGPVADLCAYEAAINHPEPPDMFAEVFADAQTADDTLRRADGVELLDLGCDPRALVEALDGDDTAEARADQAVRLALRRTSGGDVVVAELEPAGLAVLRRLADGPVARAALDLPPAELGALEQLGLVVPARWATAL